MAATTSYFPQDEGEYRRRIRAWTLYDWANSAFATTILAAVLPIYYSQVAGSTLPSEAVATSYWSLTLSAALLITAVLAPILGTVSDIIRGKKRFLSIFAGVGILGTGALFFVGSGDWMLASMIMIVARIGFTGSISFYDSLLPHVARDEDQDAVSTQGFALGYLGGGLLLAINVVMIFQLGFAEGARWSFLSVAVWWALFTIPLLRQVPEPPAATASDHRGLQAVTASFQRLRETIKDIQRYRELVKFLIAFLIYNDGIGTIIGVAAIYGAELGLGATDLILALLLVQFAGIPFSLIFGRLPSKQAARRPFFLAFILFNLVALPIVGIVGAQVLPQNVTGVLLPPYETSIEASGTGVYAADSDAVELTGDWSTVTIPAAQLGADSDVAYAETSTDGASLQFVFNGQALTLIHSTGPDHGVWSVLLDGAPLMIETDAGGMEPMTVDARSNVLRYSVEEQITVDEPGVHRLLLSNQDGGVMSVAGIKVELPVSESSLLVIMAIILLVQALAALFAWILGQHLVSNIAETLDTKRSILLALLIYAVIAIVGFVLRSTIEFWLLAWMVAIVQGGSQGLSRSLYASMSPASKSGEFFGLFGVMERFSTFLGPLIFAFAVATFGSSRPAVLAVIAFFIVGGFLLTRVDVAAGHAVARADDAAEWGSA